MVKGRLQRITLNLIITSLQQLLLVYMPFDVPPVVLLLITMIVKIGVTDKLKEIQHGSLFLSANLAIQEEDVSAVVL